MSIHIFDKTSPSPYTIYDEFYPSTTYEKDIDPDMQTSLGFEYWFCIVGCSECVCWIVDLRVLAMITKTV